MYNTRLCINSTQVHIYVCTLFYRLVHHKKKRRKKKKNLVLTSATIYRVVKNIGRNYTLPSKLYLMLYLLGYLLNYENEYFTLLNYAPFTLTSKRYLILCVPHKL